MNLDWAELLRALGLVMVIEGVLPFLAPSHWRRMLLTAAQLEGRSLRMLGLASMLAGVIVLHLA